MESLRSTYKSALWPTGLSGYIDGTPIFIKKILIIFFIFMVMPLLIMQHVLTGLFFTNGNIGMSLFAIGLSLNQLDVCLKSAYFILRIKKVRKLLLDFDEFHCLCNNNDGHIIINQERKSLAFIQKAYTVATFSNFLFFSLAPVIGAPNAVFYGIGMADMPKVLPTVYPFKIDYLPTGQIIYVVETLITFVALMFYSGINLFSLTVIRLICSVFKALETSAEKGMPLKKFVQDHVKLLKFCNEVKSFLSPILALQLVVSVLTFCFAIFDITMTGSVSNGLYNGLWYKGNIRQHKELVLVNARTLKPVRLTALSMFTLQLGTTIEVLRAAYSYYTILRKINP